MKDNVSNLIVYLIFVLLVSTTVSAFTMRTVAFDYNTNSSVMSTVTFNGQTYLANPSVDIPNVGGNYAYEITHAATGYITDTDDVFFDSQLSQCQSQSPCQMSVYLPPGGRFNTTCIYESQFQDYQCTVTNNGLDAEFFYKPSESRVTVFNYLVPTSNQQNNPPPSIAAIVSPLSGAAPLAVTFNVAITDNVMVDRSQIIFGDGQSQWIQPTSNTNHVYQYGGTYQATVVAWDDAGLSNTRNFTIIVTGPNQPIFNTSVAFTITAQTKDFTSNQTLSPSTITFDNRSAASTKTANPTAQFSVPSNTVFELTHAFPNYITDTDDMYLDYQLPSCQANTCNLTSVDYGGQQFVTNCLLNATSNQYLCSVTNQGLTSEFLYNRGTTQASYINFLVANNPQNQVPQITASVSPQQGTAPLASTFTHTVTDDGSVSQVFWIFGDGQSQFFGPSASFQHIYTQPGTYEATIAAWDNLGLSAVRKFNITITGSAQPLAPVIVSANVVPINGTVPLTSTFSNNVTDDQQVTSVIWLFGDGSQASVAPSASFQHIYTSVGAFSALLIATDNSGLQSTRNFTITVNAQGGNGSNQTNQAPNITANVTPLVGNSPLTSTFTNNVTDDQSVAAVTWFFGDGQSQSVAANAQITHTYLLNGTFNAQIIAVDNLGAASSRNFTIVVGNQGGNQTNTPPVIIANVTPLNGTAPLTSTFTNNVTDDQSVAAVMWFFGDGQAQSVTANAQFTHTYILPGTYAVQIIATDNLGLTNTRNFTVTVSASNQSNQAPVIIANITPTNGTAPLTSTFTNNVTDDQSVASVTWIFGDGFAQSVAPVSSITHMYVANGTYLASIIATDSLGVSTQRNFTITVGTNQSGNQSNTPPVIIANITPINSTAPLTSTFTNNVTDNQVVASVTWIFGDGQSQSVNANAQFTHVYQNAGVYLAQITALDNQGASSSLFFTVTVNANQSGNQSNQTNQAPVIIANITPQTGNSPLTSIVQLNVSDDTCLASTLVIFGDGQSQFVQPNSIISHTYQNAGNFTAIIIATDCSNLTSQRQFPIVVNPPQPSNTQPSLFATVTPLRGQVPLNGTFFVNASDLDGISIVAWFFGDGQAAIVNPLSVINHVYNSIGTYLAQVVAIDRFGLARWLNFTVDVVSPTFNNTQYLGPYVQASVSPANGVAPLTSTFTSTVTPNNASITSVIWLFGDGQMQGVAFNSQITHTYQNPGTYNAQIIATDSQNKTTSLTFVVTVGQNQSSSVNQQANEPQARLFVNNIIIPDAYDIKPGDELTAYVMFSNKGDVRLNDLKIALTIPELGIRSSDGAVDLKANNPKEVGVPLLLQIPQDAEPGLYTVRVTVSNDIIRRVIHREIQINDIDGGQ